MKKPYVIWLPCWYPNQLNPFSGDFIQRHAEAVSREIGVHVVHLVRDSKLKSFSFEKREHKEHSYLEITGYYNAFNFATVVSKPVSFFMYCLWLFRLVKKIIGSNGKPNAIHIHVAGRNALIGLVLARLYDIPLYYSEHASNFLPEARFSFHRSKIKRLAWLYFANRCSKVSAVSSHLASNLILLGCKRPVEVIPNVVKNSIFFKGPNQRIPSQPYQLLHVSNMGYEKNLEGTLLALNNLSTEGIEWKLEIFGPAENLPKQMIESLPGLKDRVTVSGEKTQFEIAEAMRRSDLLIAYSKLETFGCVVAEALITGLPVLVSNYPSLLELVVDGQNGIVVQSENTNELKAGLKRFFHNSALNQLIVTVNPENKFSVETIGKKFIEFYGIRI